MDAPITTLASSATADAIAEPTPASAALPSFLPAPRTVPALVPERAPRAAERRRRETIRKRDSIFRRSLALADALAVGITLYVGVIAFGSDRLSWEVFGSFALVVLLMKVVGLYDRDEHLLHKSTLDEIPAIFQVATLSTLLLWLLSGSLVAGHLSQRHLLAVWAVLFALLITGRSLARFAAGRATAVERCLLLGDAESAKLFRQKLGLTARIRAELVGWLPAETRESANGRLPLPELPADLGRIITQLDVHRVVLAPGRVDPDSLLRFIRKIRALEVSVSVLPATPAVSGSFAETDDIHGLTLLGVRGLNASRSSQLVKRAFDVVASSIMLGLLAPLLAVIAVAIKLESPGPVLFRQRRVGRNGEHFDILKFRSMVEDAHSRRAELHDLNEAEGLFKMENDPRVTRVGDVIRRFSLDELPQLVNVLKGEMSLVGPRPLIPEEDALVEGYYRSRLDLAPGITGFWQALGSSRIPLNEMVRLDYLYVATWSLWNDIRLLCRTIPYVLGRQGR